MHILTLRTRSPVDFAPVFGPCKASGKRDMHTEWLQPKICKVLNLLLARLVQKYAFCFRRVQAEQRKREMRHRESAQARPETSQVRPPSMHISLATQYAYASLGYMHCEGTR